MTPVHSTRLPAPEQLLLDPLDEMELAELIERHIEFVDEKGRAVHLPTPFVRHYLKRGRWRAGDRIVDRPAPYHPRRRYHPHRARPQS
jgi:hypothetical protein